MGEKRRRSEKEEESGEKKKVRKEEEEEEEVRMGERDWHVRKGTDWVRSILLET